MTLFFYLTDKSVLINTTKSSIPTYTKTKSLGSSSNESFEQRKRTASKEHDIDATAATTSGGGGAAAASSSNMDINDPTSMLKARKLKSHLIERFHSNETEMTTSGEVVVVGPNRPSHSQLYRNQITSPIPDDSSLNRDGGDDNFKETDYTTTKATKKLRSNDSQSLSVLILHPTHDFYFGGTLCKLLLNQRLLDEFICNEHYRPNALHKVKVDVDFTQEILIN